MKYDIHINPPDADPYWNLGAELAEGMTPADYVDVMDGFGIEVLSITPTDDGPGTTLGVPNREVFDYPPGVVVGSSLDILPSGDFNQAVRDRNGTLAVELRKGDQVRAWSVDDNWGTGIDTLLNQGWRISDYFGKRGSTPPQHDYLWGGWLIDGHPLNVITGLGWIEGQLNILVPYIDAGVLPEPHLMRKSAPVAADVLLEDDISRLITALEETNAGIMREVTKGPVGVPTALVMAGGVGLALLFLANKFM